MYLTRKETPSVVTSEVDSHFASTLVGGFSAILCAEWDPLGREYVLDLFYLNFQKRPIKNLLRIYYVLNLFYFILFYTK